MTSLFLTALIVVVMIGDSIRGKTFNSSIVVVGLLFAVSALYLKYRMINVKKDRIENSAFNMAIVNDGFVTAFEIAAISTFRLKDVNKYLNNCCENGLCEKRYTEDNLVEVFCFKDLVSLEVKKAAKPIVEIQT